MRLGADSQVPCQRLALLSFLPVSCVVHMCAEDISSIHRSGIATPGLDTFAVLAVGPEIATERGLGRAVSRGQQ